MTVVGSGATAITIVPALVAQGAAAAQLQSPASYVEQVRAAAPTLREP